MRYAVEIIPHPVCRSFWFSKYEEATDLYTDIKWFPTVESANELARMLEQQFGIRTRIVEDVKEKMSRTEGIYKVWVRMHKEDKVRIAAMMN